MKNKAQVSNVQGQIQETKVTALRGQIPASGSTNTV